MKSIGLLCLFLSTASIATASSKLSDCSRHSETYWPEENDGPKRVQICKFLKEQEQNQGWESYISVGYGRVYPAWSQVALESPNSEIYFKRVREIYKSFDKKLGVRLLFSNFNDLKRFAHIVVELGADPFNGILVSAEHQGPGELQ